MRLQPDRDAHQLRERGHIHLLHDLCAVNLDSHLAQANGCGDLLVELAAYHELHDLPLSVRERAIVGKNGGDSLDLCASRPIVAQGCLDTLKKVLIPEWLGQEVDGARFHCLHGHLHVAMSRDEDNRNVIVGCSEALLQLKSARFGQPHVEHKTFWPVSGTVRTAARQEFLCASESFDLLAGRAQQATDSFSQRSVIFDYEHGGGVRRIARCAHE